MSPKALFTHKDGNYKIPMIGAMKSGDSWETEEECLARVKDMFDVEDVECFWDADLDPPGFVAIQPNGGPGKEEAPVEPIVDDKVVVGIPDVSARALDKVTEPESDVEEIITEPDETILEEAEEEALVMDAVLDDPGEEELPAEDEPEASVDGNRTYELTDLKTSTNLLEDTFSKWKWEGDNESLLAKLTEEYNEAINGTREPIEKSGDSITVVGTSAASELLTIALICAKFYHGNGVSLEQFISLLSLRHEEQYLRYQEVNKSSPTSEESEVVEEEV